VLLHAHRPLAQLYYYNFQASLGYLGVAGFLSPSGSTVAEAGFHSGRRRAWTTAW